MTSNEIRAEVSPMVIWMADAAIRAARRAICKQTGWDDVKRADYNLPEVETASTVLFNMFGTYEAAIRMALIKMPDNFDGIRSVPGKKYFDAFVETLEWYLQQGARKEHVTIREPDWVLAAL